MCCEVVLLALVHSSGGVLQRLLCLSEISKLCESTDIDRNTCRGSKGREERSIAGFLKVKKCQFRDSY